MKSTVSIGICTHNDQQTIGNLLDQINQVSQLSTEETTFQISEVIVVSSGSVDGTNSIIKQFKAENNHTFGFISVLEEQRHGKSHAINQILKINQSEFIILVPADVMINQTSINYLVNHIIDNKEVGIVSGKPIPNLENIQSTIIKSTLNLIWKLHNQTLKITSQMGINSHASGELMVMRSDTVKHIPHHIINDDAYLSNLIHKMGYQVDYEDLAEVKIETPHTIRDYFIQRKRIVNGHKQIKRDYQLTTSNFKDIMLSDPKLGIQILLATVTSMNLLLGFVFAVFFEIKIEMWLFLTQSKEKKYNPVWKRIQHYSSSPFK